MTRHLFILLLFSSSCLAACESAIEPAESSSVVEVNGQSSMAGKLTPEKLHADPSIDGPTLKRPAISPDGSMVTVLQGRATDARQQDLWAYDIQTGDSRLLVSSTDLLGAPEELSEEEKNRRERAREYGSGIVSYDWVDETTLLFPLGGDVYLYNLDTQTAQQVTATKGFETDAKVSPTGKHVAYVRKNNLFVTDLSTGLERQLTDGATDVIRNATASFVVQEELDRDTGYWWSPDDSRLAYTQIDESPIAIENRLDFTSDDVGLISQRYPFTGTPNATVKLGFVSRIGGDTVWADLGEDQDIYLTRVAWRSDGQGVYAGVLSRDNKSHKILAIDSTTGQSSLLLEETSTTWLNIRSEFIPLKSGAMLFSSEQSDKRQIFKLDNEGNLTAITPDDVMVRSISCVNEDTGQVYFEGWAENPLEQHIFSQSLTEKKLTQLSSGEGEHKASFSGNCSRYIGTFSNPDTPPQTRAFDNTGEPLTWLNENNLDAAHPYAPYLVNHISPEYGQIPAEDGTLLDYFLFKPLDLGPLERRPAITIVYGGPGVQRVNKSWSRKHLARMLAHNGFVVFMLDNRGATNRGKAFEDHLYRAMGQVEVQDQSIGADWLASQPFVDSDNMGVYGWSYGGYMALHMLAQTNHYKSGVSGAPVTDWRLYDTAYTERYLGDPTPGRPNHTPGAYENSSVFTHLEGLTEPVLLIHGMADDNVVFRHSIMLMEAMQKSGQQNLRLMTYPGEKHGFRATENKIHRDRLILEFFQDTLLE